MRKVVLDTNVLVSGIIASGYSAKNIPILTPKEFVEKYSIPHK
jgi:predicted nucleic acid-binding protein